MVEKLSIDQLKSDRKEGAQELPKGVFKASEVPKELTPIDIDTLAKDMPKREDFTADETWEKKQWNQLDAAVERFKQEHLEFRRKIEEYELYESDDLDEDKPSATGTSTNDSLLDQDDDDDFEMGYVVPKVKLEDNAMTEEKVMVDERVVAEPVTELPRMKAKESTTLDLDKVKTPVVEKTVMVTKEVEPPVNLDNVSTETSQFLDDDEFDDDDSLDEVTTESERKERIAHVRSVVKTAYESTLDKIDISKFTISKKPVTVSNALAAAGAKIQVADWVLRSSEMCISVSQLSGPEIEALDVSGSNRGMYNAYLDMFKVIYKHVENPNKGTLEQWLRTISFYDMQDLYFALYRACFGKNNHILYSCDKCKETYMAQKPIEDMVAFKSDEIKAKFKEIMDKGVANSEPKYEANMVQITNDYVVSIRIPSVYDATLGPALLDDSWRQKYADLIGTCTFIDAIYRINRETSELEVISTNPVRDDDVKTMKNRIKTYSKIFSTFTSKEYAKLKGVISNLGTNADEIEYYIPADTCRKCGAEIPKQPMDPLQMLFTYHQLGQAAYISEN